MFRIGPRLQTYAWGMTDALPDLLGVERSGSPIAEAWWGAHESAPSPILDGPAPDLATWISGEPAAMSGMHELPYLLKVLAIERPLSIQVHPAAGQASAGYTAEEAAGVPRAAPHRVFRDPRHKPEMIVAFTTLRLLVGFRPVREVAADLRDIGAPEMAALVEDRESLLTFVMAVLGGADVSEPLAKLSAHSHDDGAVGFAAHAARCFPGDPGALVALAMNPVVLTPGQACFVPPRTVHSYQSGIGVEIMANSDTVVRGGLTSKPVDIAHLEAIVDAAPSMPQRCEPIVEGATSRYEPACEEFSLVRIERGSADIGPGPRIVLALGDGTTVTTADDSVALAPGDAVFVPPADGRARVDTASIAFVAQAGGG